MITNRRFKHFITLFLSPFLISGILFHPAIITYSHAASFITSDGTMGTAINQAGNIYNINGGTIRGTNQFHSFGLFSVGTGDTASFNGPGGIANIIGRVTGGQQSIIDGILRSTITGANLYLLNPYGVLFGPNASLDVSGSFHVSTADYLRLSDGGIFYSNPLKSSVLTTAPPVAFGFLSSTPAPITILESFLQVPRGKTLSVVGGDITITGGPTGAIYAPSGQINIASVASPGEVIPIESRDAPDLQMSSFDLLGNINLLNWAYLDVSSSRGNGTVVIRGGRLLIEDSNIVANTLGNIDGAKKGVDIGISDSMEMRNSLIQAVTAGDGQGGDVIIRSGSIEMKSSSGIMALTQGSGNSGNIEVNTGSLDMREGSQMINNVDFFSDGNAGNLAVTADSILMTGAYDPIGNTTGLYSATGIGSTGRGGDLKVTTGNLEVRDGATIFTTTNGSGAGGNIDINAESILVSGKNAKGLSATIAAWSNSSGNAGGIRINTGNLEVRNGYISTSSGYSGKAGDLEVTAADWILLTEGAGLYANGYIADGGNIRIKAESLEVTDGAQIMSNSMWSGAGGDIEVTANSILLSGVDSQGNRSGISSSVVSDLATGAGGDIRINAQNLEVKEGATIMAATIGPGDGGKIELNAESVLISGTKDGYSSSLITTTASSGKAGDIRITAKNLEVKDGGWIEASTYGSGNSGSIDVTADNVVVSGVSEGEYALIWALNGSDSSGKGGFIRIATNSLEIKDGGQINVSTLGQGDGGSIIVTAKNIFIDGGSHTEKGVGLYADTYGSGNAGDININTNTLEMRGLAQISTSTRAEGQGGSLFINADQMILSGTDGNVSTGLYSQAESSGSGGIIQVTAGSLQINDGAIISSSTKSSGNAGNISVTAPWITMANGGAIRARTRGTGTGGNIQLSGNQIQLINGASISAESLGTGNAGDIDINAGSTLLMKNSSITTEATQADGGNIHIKAGYMVNLIDSKITASVGGGPQTTGGNITIDPQFVILNSSQIIANAYEGTGGNIRIIADVFLATPDSIVDASSALGIDGTVDIQAPIQNISGTLTPMQGNFLSAEALLRDRCAARIRGEKSSSFVVSGRDGLPIRPGSVLPSPIY
jgi:filamentous hemagglutinin family protein